MISKIIANPIIVPIVYVNWHIGLGWEYLCTLLWIKLSLSGLYLGSVVSMKDIKHTKYIVYSRNTSNPTCKPPIYHWWPAVRLLTCLSQQCYQLQTTSGLPLSHRWPTFGLPVAATSGPQALPSTACQWATSVLHEV